MMLGGRCMLPSLVLWAVALATAVAIRQDSAAFTGVPLLPSSQSSLRKSQRKEVAAPRPSPKTSAAASTSMSLLRTFEANELQLQRFIGELGFVEITDW